MGRLFFCMPLWPKGVIPRCRGDALAAYCMLVNCGPAKGCCLPDIDRHRRGCARDGLRGMEGERAEKNKLIRLNASLYPPKPW